MSRVPGGSFARDTNATKVTSSDTATSSGRPVTSISRFGSVDCSRPTSSFVGRGGTLSPSKPGVSDPLKLIKVENPLSQQASQTLSLLERQNQLKKELKTEAVQDDPNTNWESSLSNWKNRRRSQSSYQPKVLELNANENDELDSTVANVRTFRQLMEQRKERSDETNGKGSYMYDEPTSPREFSRSPETKNIPSPTSPTARQAQPTKTGLEATRRLEIQNADRDRGELAGEVGLRKTKGDIDSLSSEVRPYRSYNLRRSATEESAPPVTRTTVSKFSEKYDIEKRLEDATKRKAREPSTGKLDLDDERGKDDGKAAEIRKINSTGNEADRKQSAVGNDGDFSGSNGLTTNRGRPSLTERDYSGANGAELRTEKSPGTVWPERRKEDSFSKTSVSLSQTYNGDDVNRLTAVTSAVDGVSKSTHISTEASTGNTEASRSPPVTKQASPIGQLQSKKKKVPTATLR